MMYKLYMNENGKEGAMTTSDIIPAKSFLFDVNNEDYQAYLAWLELGNTPLPADTPS